MSENDYSWDHRRYCTYEYHVRSRLGFGYEIITSGYITIFSKQDQESVHRLSVRNQSLEKRLLGLYPSSLAAGKEQSTHKNHPRTQGWWD